MEDREKINSQLKNGIWGDKQHSLVFTLGEDGKNVYSEINGDDSRISTTIAYTMIKDERTMKLILNAVSKYESYINKQN